MTKDVRYCPSLSLVSESKIEGVYTSLPSVVVDRRLQDSQACVSGFTTNWNRLWLTNLRCFRSGNENATWKPEIKEISRNGSGYELNENSHYIGKRRNMRPNGKRSLCFRFHFTKLVLTWGSRRASRLLIYYVSHRGRGMERVWVNEFVVYPIHTAVLSDRRFERFVPMWTGHRNSETGS